jgi:hypothetical protein
MPFRSYSGTITVFLNFYMSFYMPEICTPEYLCNRGCMSDLNASNTKYISNWTGGILE